VSDVISLLSVCHMPCDTLEHLRFSFEHLAVLVFPKVPSPQDTGTHVLDATSSVLGCRFHMFETP